jgi:hypothetical protein
MALVIYVYIRDVLDDVFAVPTKVMVANNQHGKEFHTLLQKYIGCGWERATHGRGIAIYHQAVRAKPWWEKFRGRVLDRYDPNQVSCGESIVCFPNGYCAVVLVATSSGFRVRLDTKLEVRSEDAGGWEDTQRQRRQAAHNSMIDLTVDPLDVSSSFRSPVSGSTLT